jgi:chromosome segregation ATPase
VNFLNAGGREIIRKACRQRLRFSGWLRARQLRHAEVELGWLGWEQADFFDAEMESEIAKIRVFEKEQAQLVNASADLSAHIQEIEEKRAKAKTELEEKLKNLATERAPLEATRAEAVIMLRNKREWRGRMVRNVEDSHRLRDGLQKGHDELLAIEPRTAETLADIHRVVEEQGRAERERTELKNTHSRLNEEIATLEEAIAELDRQLSVFYGHEREARGKFEALETERAAKIAESEHERAASAKQMAELDTKKTEPYRRLGQCLADNNIAPRNQPDALIHVHELRDQLAAAEQEIARSLDETASENPGDLAKFYALLIFVLVALMILFWLLSHRH